MAAKEFWQIYLQKVVEEMLEGKKWYEFSMASLRTFRELGMAKKSYKNGHVFKYEGFKIFINALGKPLMMVYEEQKYMPPKGRLNFELFSVSLPIQNIEAR